jgi:hypothetical protein
LLITQARIMSAGLALNMSTYRPTTASNGRSKATWCGSPTRKDTLPKTQVFHPRLGGADGNSRTVDPDDSLAPTMAATSAATSPPPLPMSRTRIPAASPVIEEVGRLNSVVGRSEVGAWSRVA